MRHFSVASISKQATRLLGTPTSIILHTIFFMSMFLLVLFGWKLEDMLLMLTTILSIEAIYLSLFIQMTVNETSQSIESVEGDIDDIEKDIDDIQKDEKNDTQYDQEVAKTLKAIESRLTNLQSDLEVLRKKGML